MEQGAIENDGVAKPLSLKENNGFRTGAEASQTKSKGHCMYKENQFVNQEFIPWPDYAICPNCNEKVDIPKDRKLFRLRSEEKQFLCPYCNEPIKHIELGKFRGPPSTIK